MNDVYSPFFHLFKTPGAFYIYDVNTDSILKTDYDTYTYLKNLKPYENISDKNAPESIRKMLKYGLLSSHRIKEIRHPETNALKYYLNNKITMITLQVTQNCNLRCKYCTYSGGYNNRGHSDKKMSFEMAKRGIDYLIAHSYEREWINVGFYGGEPLLMFDLIKRCMQYAETAAEGKKVTFSITTNGTLITEDIIKYFSEHAVSVMISLDGPREIHDKNRKMAGGSSGSFDFMMRNVEMIKRKFPDYYSEHVSFNTVIDPRNDFSCVNNFIADASLFSDQSFSSSLVTDRYAKRQVKPTDAFTSERNYELFKILLCALGRLKKKYVSKLLLEQYEITRKDRGGKQNHFTHELPEKGHHSGPCIPGVQRLMLSADGTFYPCERVSELSDVMKIGDIDHGIDVKKAENLLNMGRISEKACRNCWAFYYCTACAGSADNTKELSYDVLKRGCEGIRSSTEYLMKDYCTLREFGMDFQNDNEFISEKVMQGDKK